MLNFKSGYSLFHRYREDTQGNMALTFALCSVVVVGTMGAAMDYSTLTSAKSQSQSIADATALTAAIFVKTKGRIPSKPKPNKDGSMPSEEGFQHKKPYTAAELGYDYSGWVDGGADNVNVVVSYDDNAKEATVTVKGNTIPTFIQVLGKKELIFEAKSVVSYYEIEDAFPASIAMVLDNSGSMRWDDQQMIGGQRPSNPVARLDALKTSVRTFRKDMIDRLGRQRAEDGQRVLRTGILPYNSEILTQTNGQDYQMRWGYNGMSNVRVNEMKADGGTNSNPPMAEAMSWLSTEDGYHRNEAKKHEVAYRQPLKFVIFMTDGQNSTGDLEFIADDDAGTYYKRKDDGSGWWIFPNWALNEGYNPENYGYDEGRIELNSDRLTVESCRAMHAQGTQIFTIGYGLNVGTYYEPWVDNPPAGDTNIYTHGQVNQTTRSTAMSLLQSCASDPGNFIMASDGEELEGAFDQIQNAIVKELIRIKT